MPDTIVPVIRRPVRRVSASPDPKDALSNQIRKLSIGEESSQHSLRLRKTWDAETGRMVTASEPLDRKKKEEEVKVVLTKEPAVVKEPIAEVELSDGRRPALFNTAYSGYPNVTTKPHLPVARNRPIKTSKDLELERILLKWLVMVAGRKAEDTSFEKWIQDGSVLAKAMISVNFNSVPLEMVNCNWGASPVTDRVKRVILEMTRFGVSEVFEAEDLMELRNVPRVCRSLARLCRLAAADSKSDELQSVARQLPSIF